jgi:hypothetical protein
LVYETTIVDNQILNLSTFASGLYIVRTSAGDVSRFVKD